VGLPVRSGGRRRSCPGALVQVRDERGKRLGSALYSSASQIAIRLLSSDEITEKPLPDLLSARISGAVEFRRPAARDTDSYRVIFSEADLLPGLIVDKYNDVLAMQALTQAFDRDDLRQVVLGSLSEHFPDASVLERVDAHIRKLEELPPRDSQVQGWPVLALLLGQGGGRAVEHYLHAERRALPLRRAKRPEDRSVSRPARELRCGGAVRSRRGARCLHVSGRICAASARVCDKVTAVDSSRPALEVAEQNEQLNREQHRCGRDRMDRGQCLRPAEGLCHAGRQYDTIVLDPPAFAKTKRAVSTALRAYKELNLRALKMLRPGGILVTCSCSFHVSEAEFLEMLGSAAADAGRVVRVLEKRGAAMDHPALLNVPETAYLKCMICEVES
jgi:23S rRNA (cytosine1962-C5)-methyltransferase